MTLNVIQKKVLSFGPNRTVEVRPNSSAEPSVRSVTTVTFGLMYGLYSRAASNQERLMMARVR